RQRFGTLPHARDLEVRDMNEMYLNDGDATFVGSFTKVCWDRDNGQRYSFGFKPNRGKKFVVMLLGEADKTADDFDLEAALNRLGFYRREKS
ncbi:hypothetical protein, partial [Pseudomonas aeruginosa]|uniref:hypothetical protein n=4 Tax=Pseudomonas aeruginosa TaxID=287 RepID=UPI0027C67CF7